LIEALCTSFGDDMDMGRLSILGRLEAFSTPSF